MRAYELVLVLRPALTDSDRKKLLTGVMDFFDKPQIIKEDDWGQKPLSYPIKRETAGYFVRYHFQTEGQIPADIEKRILTHDSVLRHLFLKSKVKMQKAKVEPKEKNTEASRVEKIAKTKKEKKIATKKVAKKKKSASN